MNKFSNSSEKGLKKSFSSKKGSLSLSITAIVVIVIAFVVLGLALHLTRMIFGGAEKEILGTFDITELEAKPSSENPITVPTEVTIGRGSSETMKIGFYNTAEETAVSAAFAIKTCLKGGEKITENLPSIDSISADVGPSDSQGYSIVFYENELLKGTYICVIGLKCIAETCPNWIDEEKFYESKQFFLKVVS
jgi:hypothetical protein